MNVKTKNFHYKALPRYGFTLSLATGSLRVGTPGWQRSSGCHKSLSSGSPDGHCSSRCQIHSPGSEIMWRLMAFSPGSLVFLPGNGCWAPESLAITEPRGPPRQNMSKRSACWARDKPVGNGVEWAKPWNYVLTALLPRINGFHVTCSSLILFCSIYLVQALGLHVMKGPLHFIPVFLESSESLMVQLFQPF